MEKERMSPTGNTQKRTCRGEKARQLEVLEDTRK